MYDFFYTYMLKSEREILGFFISSLSSLKTKKKDFVLFYKIINFLSNNTAVETFFHNYYIQYTNAKVRTFFGTHNALSTHLSKKTKKNLTRVSNPE